MKALSNKQKSLRVAKSVILTVGLPLSFVACDGDWVYEDSTITVGTYGTGSGYYDYDYDRYDDYHYRDHSHGRRGGRGHRGDRGRRGDRDDRHSYGRGSDRDTGVETINEPRPNPRGSNGNGRGEGRDESPRPNNGNRGNKSNDRGTTKHKPGLIPFEERGNYNNLDPKRPGEVFPGDASRERLRRVGFHNLSSKMNTREGKKALAQMPATVRGAFKTSSNGGRSEYKAAKATLKEMSKLTADRSIYESRYGLNRLGAYKLRAAFIDARNGNDKTLKALGFKKADIERMARLEQPSRSSMKTAAAKLGTSLSKVDNFMNHMRGSVVSTFDKKLAKERSSARASDNATNPFLADY